jgi:hypothetical protein
MSRRDSVQSSFTGAPEGRLSLPFLPTLVTALVIGAASMLCREPAKAPVAPAAEIGPQAFAPSVAVAPPPRAPAAVIFAEHYPLAAGAVPRPAPRLAVAASRRQLMRAAEAPPRRPEGLVAKPAPDPLAAARVERSEEVVEQAEGLLPDLALPYAAPAARAAGRAVDEATRYVRDRAAAVTGTVGGTVRGSVSVLVEAMR